MLRQMVGGVKLPSGQRLPPLRSTDSSVHSKRLKRTDKLVVWARMRIRLWSLSLQKRIRRDRTIFAAGCEEIPLLSRQPILSCGHSTALRQADGVGSREAAFRWPDQNRLEPAPWQVQSMVWPIHILPKNSSIRKWLGLPGSLSDAGLW